MSRFDNFLPGSWPDLIIGEKFEYKPNDDFKNVMLTNNNRVFSGNAFFYMDHHIKYIKRNLVQIQPPGNDTLFWMISPLGKFYEIRYFLEDHLTYEQNQMSMISNESNKFLFLERTVTLVATAFFTVIQLAKKWLKI